MACNRDPNRDPNPNPNPNQGAWRVHGVCMACAWRVHVLTCLLHVWPGPSPTVGNIVGFNAKVSIGDQVIVDPLGSPKPYI